MRTPMQLSSESSEDGRNERVVGGPHKAVRGRLFFTAVYACIAAVTWLAFVILVNLVL